MTETARCRMCHNPIQRASPEEPWKHIGIQPRHPGVPEHMARKSEPVRHLLCNTMLTIREQLDGSVAPWCPSCQVFPAQAELSSQGPFSVKLEGVREVE